MADRIDRMLERLREALPEITWDRDAVSEDAAPAAGCIEMVGGRGFYADGKMLAQSLQLDVWISVAGSGTEYLDRVQAVLEEFADEGDFAWHFPERRYAYNIDEVIWRWRCECDGLDDGGEEGA